MSILLQLWSPPHWYASSEWWLVIIAAFTGLAIAYQARETARATEAMRDQVSTQKESLRARITIGFKNNVFAEILHNGRAVVSAKFINTGGTPAYKVVPETWIEFVPREFVDFTSFAIHHIGGPVAVYPTAPTFFDIPIGRRASYDEISGLRQAQMTLGVRI